MSRFVSGGTNEEPTERDEEWLKAQQEIEAKRRDNAEAAKQQDGKSLYETLQANKAAKQEAFEESIRLRNQFRSLDEDEVEFLDSVLESTRAKEAAVKKETAEELDAFRRQQEEAERAAKTVDAGPATVAEDTGTNWAVGRKRKKGKDDVFGGVKLRKASSGDKASSEVKTVPGSSAAKTSEASSSADSSSVAKPPAVEQTSINSTTGPSKTAPPQDKPPVPSLGLAAYSSDEDD